MAVVSPAVVSPEESPEQARDRYAAPMLARLREECEAAPAEIRPLLEYIRKHFWDFDLVAVVTRRLRRKRQLRDGFRETFGCTPLPFLRDRRMEVAFPLLRETSLSIQEICRLLGYDTIQKLHFAFKSCSGGVGPREWRRQVAAAGGPVSGLIHTDLKLWLRALASPWRKDSSAQAGGVPSSTARALLAHTLEASPPWWLKTQDAAGETDGEDGLGYEVWKAATVWKVAESRPHALRKAVISYPVPMKSLVLFEILSDMSRGCRDASQARNLAELARCSLDACVGLPGGQLADTRSLAWTRLGRLALQDDERGAAERALGIAEVEGAAGSEPSVRARRLEAAAELAFRQGRHEAAAELAAKALDVYAGLHEHDRRARCLLLREKARAGRSGPESRTAVAELESALDALGATGSPEVTRSLRAELASAYVRAGALEKAKAVIGKMEKQRVVGDDD